MPYSSIEQEECILRGTKESLKAINSMLAIFDFQSCMKIKPPEIFVSLNLMTSKPSNGPAANKMESKKAVKKNLDCQKADNCSTDLTSHYRYLSFSPVKQRSNSLGFPVPKSRLAKIDQKWIGKQSKAFTTQSKGVTTTLKVGGVHHSKSEDYTPIANQRRSLHGGDTRWSVSPLKVRKQCPFKFVSFFSRKKWEQ